MKKLTLNKAWELCMSQWRWIVKMIRAGDDRYVGELKIAWLEKHKYENDEIDGNCFFCHYNRQGGVDDEGCVSCPGVIVDKAFSCDDDDYDYLYEPIKFYNKLRSLNRKRNK